MIQNYCFYTDQIKTFLKGLSQGWQARSQPGPYGDVREFLAVAAPGWSWPVRTKCSPLAASLTCLD